MQKYRRVWKWAQGALCASKEALRWIKGSRQQQALQQDVGVYRPIYSDGGQFKRLNGSTWMEWVFGDLRILSVGPTHASIKYPVQTYGRYPRLISPAMTLGGTPRHLIPAISKRAYHSYGWYRRTKLWHSHFFPRQSQKALRSSAPGTIRPLVSGMRVEMSMSLFRKLDGSDARFANERARTSAQ
jgi:hypothetical protein